MIKKLILFFSFILLNIFYVFPQTYTHAKITAYMAVKSQCNSNPYLTADMTKIVPSKVKNGTQRIVAISRDLEYLFPMGSIIKIEGLNGTYTVHDRMNKRFKHYVDVLVPNKNETYNTIANLKPKTKITLIHKPNKK